jgi:hypothetical protein
MFVYRKGSPWYLIFSMYGSAIPRACIPGLFSACVSFMLDVFVPYDSYLKHLIEHPYPFQPFAYIAAFVLVFRTNIAYNRYWEMATQVHLMTAKWGDALAEAVTFDELPRGKTPEERGKKLASRRRFQALMVRRFSLMHGLALQYLRRDDQLDNLSHVSPLAPTSVPMGLGTFGGPFGHESRHEAAWQLMEARQTARVPCSQTARTAVSPPTSNLHTDMASATPRGHPPSHLHTDMASGTPRLAAANQHLQTST